MNKIVLSLALGAAACFAVPAAHAASAQDSKPVAAATEGTVQATDMSSHRRKWRRHRHHHHHFGHYRPYYRSHAYYPRPYYYRRSPGISFSFGVGPRWGHHPYGW